MKSVVKGMSKKMVVGGKMPMKKKTVMKGKKKVY